MVASNGLLGSAPPPGAPPPPPPPPTVALPPVGLTRLDTKRRDSGDSEARSTHSSSNSVTEDHAPNKIFVGGISFQTTPEKLRAYFAPYGTILDVMVLKDPATNVSAARPLVCIGCSAAGVGASLPVGSVVYR